MTKSQFDSKSLSIGAFWSIVAIILSYPIGISIQNAAAELQVQFLFRFGSGCGLDVCDEGEFLNPSGVAVDSSENIIVAGASMSQGVLL